MHVFLFFPFFLFFSAQRTKDLARKQEKVGPFECDVLEKQSRVSARCYPLTVHILHDDKRKRTQNNTLLSQLYPPIRHAKRQNALSFFCLAFLFVFMWRPMNACDKNSSNFRRKISNFIEKREKNENFPAKIWTVFR